MSKRAISLKAKASPGYLHSILTEGKDPTVEKMVSICEAMHASPSWVMFGLNVSPEDEELLQVVRQNPKSRDTVLALIRSLATS